MDTSISHFIWLLKLIQCKRWIYQDGIFRWILSCLVKYQIFWISPLKINPHQEKCFAFIFTLPFHQIIILHLYDFFYHHVNFNQEHMMSVTLQRYGKTNYMVGDMKLMVYLLLVYTSMETINIAKQIGTLYTNKTKFNFLKMKWTEVFTTQTILVAIEKNFLICQQTTT